jgi:hypothetical protein
MTSQEFQEVTATALMQILRNADRVSDSTEEWSPENLANFTADVASLMLAWDLDSTFSDLEWANR